MPSLYFGNFHCEHQWAEPRRSPNARLLRLNAELAPTLVGACSAGDAIWVGELVEPDFGPYLVNEGLPSVRCLDRDSGDLAGDELAPWGWTPSVVDFGRDRRLVFEPPDIESVRRVNRRSFAFDLECDLDFQPPGVRLLRDASELPEAITGARHVSDRWVAKAEFGMSARERILGEGGRVDDSVVGWLERRIARDGCVVFEPWLDVIEEAGVQWTVRPDGTAELDGVVPLLTDHAGRYLGSRVVDDLDDVWGEDIDQTRVAAERVAATGYHGPVGFDVCRYRLDREIRVRPLQDLNARWTMGRLAMGFARHLGPGTWRHVRWPAESAAEWFRDRTRDLPRGVRVVRTSPFRVGDDGVRHGSLYVSGRDVEAVDAVLARFANEGVARG